MRTTRLFLGNLPHEAGELELTRWVESAGCHVLKAEIVRDHMSGHNRGFGFVTLESENIAGVRDSLEAAKFMGRKITVGDAKPKASARRDASELFRDRS